MVSITVNHCIKSALSHFIVLKCQLFETEKLEAYSIKFQKVSVDSFLIMKLKPFIWAKVCISF